MIDLKFGKYGIKTADRLNIVLYELIENKKEDSKNYGKTYEKVLGYYSGLEHALNAYVKIAMADDDLDLVSVDVILCALNTIRYSIREQCNRLIHHKEVEVIPIEVVENYLSNLIGEWDKLGDRKYELANMQVYNHIRKEQDDLAEWREKNV